MEHILAFLEYLSSEKKYSPHTVRAYKKDLEAFNEFLIRECAGNLSTTDYQHIRGWVLSLVKNEISNRSINRKVSSLNTFFKFLIKVGVRDSNPLRKHKALRIDKNIQIPFSEAELTEVLSQLASEVGFTSVRNKLMVELLYGTGMRRKELLNLKVSDINWSVKSIKVLGKRNKERIIPLIPPLVQSLENYMKYREEVNTNNYDDLFLTEKGAKIYEMLVYRIINKYFSKVSSKLKCSPHVLRHSFATHLLNEGADINSVKELLGHSSLASTQVYTHSSIAELKKAHSRSHPRNKK